MDLYYRIIKCEIDELGNLLSLGPIPGKFLNLHQANIKIKTLDPMFHYITETVYLKDKFYKIRNFFNLHYYQPTHNVTIDTNVFKTTSTLYIGGTFLDTFSTLEEAKVALTTLGIPLEGLD